MRVIDLFVRRPVIALVLNLALVLIGLRAATQLPIQQYPRIESSSILITTVYVGASADSIRGFVTTPIERAVSSITGIDYVESSSVAGLSTVTARLKLNHPSTVALTEVGNRLGQIRSELPQEIESPVVEVQRADRPYATFYVSVTSDVMKPPEITDYLSRSIQPRLSTIANVQRVGMEGARPQAMRIWLDADRLAAFNLGASEVEAALLRNNFLAAVGRTKGSEVQVDLLANTDLKSVEEFERLIVREDSNRIVRISDLGRVELGSEEETSNVRHNGKDAVYLSVWPLPGTNEIAVAYALRAELERIRPDLPAGTEIDLAYDGTVYMENSLKEIAKTFSETVLIVGFIVFLFLGSWRSALVPLVTIPISLIGAIAAMMAMGFSLNLLTLLAIVLSVGIVVDDAIVVVENVERWMATGLDARSATLKAMQEVTGPVIAITLVLCSVFIPTAFIAGITGQFYRQFALTIAASTVISAMNAMTMTPSRAVQIFQHRKPGEHHYSEALPRWGYFLVGGFLFIWLFAGWILHYLGVEVGHGKVAGVGDTYRIGGTRLVLFLLGGILLWSGSRVINLVLGKFFRAFNRFFDWATRIYGQFVARLLRLTAVGLLVYAGLMALTWLGFRTIPVGFIPEQDKGYLVVAAQLPDGASLERTNEIMAEVANLAKDIPGVAHTISVPGFSLLSGSNLSNSGTMFVPLEPFEERAGHPEKSSQVILAELRKRFFPIQDALVLAFGPPPVEGLGSTGGFKLQIEDLRAAGPEALQGAVDNLIEKGNAQPGMVGLFSTFRTGEPQLYLEIDRTKAKSAGVALSDVFATLQAYLGSAYVNDFTRFGRNWQVNVQADSKFRVAREDIGKLKVRNASGEMVPLASVLDIRDVTGPSIVSHYKMYASADINGSLLPGMSSGKAIQVMNQLAESQLPQGMQLEWTDLSYQQIEAGKDLLTKLVFPLGVLFVFFVLSAQYESWSLPFTIILIVPMCLLAAITGVWIARMDNNVFTQIGLVVLIALASKNAILIVEFARQLQKEGSTSRDAVVEACRLRLRPILMTSLAFILGVVPLVIAQGAGSEMRRALGVAVFSGMLGVTVFGLIFTPMFYVAVTWFTERSKQASSSQPAAHAQSEPGTSVPGVVPPANANSGG